MPTGTRQHLPPCCHGIVLPRKDTPKVRFKSELAKYAVATATKDALPRLAAALTDARTALQLDRAAAAASSGAATSAFASMDDLQDYLSALREYLSLVRGFTVPAARLVSDARPPVVTDPTASAPVDPNHAVATLDPAAGGGAATPQAAQLLQPLLDPAATGVDLAAPRSKCLAGMCSWRDVLTTANAYAPNARVEAAQALLAAGLHLLQAARARVDAMLAERVTEIPEAELKMAYQLLLHAAGVLDACLRALGMTPRALSANVADLSATATTTASAGAAPQEAEEADDEAVALERWREEQRRLATGSATTAAPPSHAATTISDDDDLSMLSRLPDLARGRFPQLLAWLALAQAQELVVLRGVSRDFVDYTLMAKLAVDVAHRYDASHELAVRHLPAAVASPVAERLRRYCVFKHAYYTAVSRYFQGAACLATDDARHCAQAIADLKQAAALIQRATACKAQYDATAPKDERDRLFAVKTVYVRAEQIIQRDLEIATRRNDAVYYERIPEPAPPSEPVSLVRAVEFPDVEVHALWHDPDINTCIQATNPRAMSNATRSAAAPAAAGRAQAPSGGGDPRKGGCCDGCTIA